jgi:hypothetical protein
VGAQAGGVLATFALEADGQAEGRGYHQPDDDVDLHFGQRHTRRMTSPADSIW